MKRLEIDGFRALFGGSRAGDEGVEYGVGLRHFALILSG
jgi:hypothetical protein